MKKLFLMFLLLNVCNGYSQNIEDFGRIVLNSYVPKELNLKIDEANLLETKLSQIASNYGIAGKNSNSRFVITANVNLQTKDIVSGPPQMIAQNVNVTVFIGDAVEGNLYSSITFSLKGVGATESKAYIDAFKKLRTESEELNKFIEVGKNGILDYYKTNCDILIAEATSYQSKDDYDGAIYSLMQIPNTCFECYQKALQLSDVVYKGKIDAEGKALLAQANIIWSTSPNKEGSMKIKPFLLRIDKNASCYNQVVELNKKIEAKLTADEIERLRAEEQKESRKYQLALQNAKHKNEIEKIRVNAYKEIAVEYLRNQPKTRVYYRNVYWY